MKRSTILQFVPNQLDVSVATSDQHRRPVFDSERNAGEPDLKANEYSCEEKLSDSLVADLQAPERGEPAVENGPPNRDSPSQAASNDDRMPGPSQPESTVGNATENHSRSLFFRVGKKIAHSVHWLLGLAGIIFCVAIAAVIPLLQFAALGYLLEVSGRIRKRGTVWAGCVGFNQAAQLAGIIIGTWLMLWPVTLLGVWWEASFLIDPNSETTRNLRVLQWAGTVLILGHIFSAWFCGGKLRHFFWPLVAPFAFALWGLRKLVSSKWLQPINRLTIGKLFPQLMADLANVRPVSEWFVPAMIWNSLRRRNLISSSRDQAINFLAELKLPYLFWLGFRGFIGTMIWLTLPVLIMLVSASSVDGIAVLTGLIGILSFAIVASYLPILQAHYAAENKLTALLEVRVARESFRRAPIRYLVTLTATFVLAIPLFIFKIERIFPELLFLPAIFFVTFMLPVRFIAGWTYLNACNSSKRASWFYRWPAWLVMMTLAILFSSFVFVMRFVTWSGAAGLFDQHAFLTPAPFVEWPF